MSTATSTTRPLTIDGIGDVEVTVTDRGTGHPFLLLHGGGGPATVTPWADRLAEAEHARVITPVHPGFNGTPRPDALNSPRGLAVVYTELLEALGLGDVTVIGNSIGGWIAAEMAVLGSSRVSSYILVDAVGIEVPDHPVPDFFSLTPAEVAQRSYYDPARFGIDPAALPPAAQAAMAGNRATLAVYGGNGMADPTLAPRLGAVRTPALVAWGEADRIGDPDFGRAFAAAIPGAEFRLLEHAGHLPQIETPGVLVDVVWSFADAHAAG
ncbi:MAG TPA: alpha/beta hydrolase [Trebonia sp.]